MLQRLATPRTTAVLPSSNWGMNNQNSVRLFDDRKQRLRRFLCCPVEVEVTGVEEAPGLDVAHGGEQAFAQARVLLLEAAEHSADRFADSTGALGAAARDNRRAERCREPGGDLFGDIDQGPDEAEFAVARPGDRRQRTDATREQSVPQKRFAEVVGRVTERDDVGAESADHFVDGAPAVAAAKVAAVVGLLAQKAVRRLVVVVSP